MNIKIKKLSINDGEDIYRMLQDIPASDICREYKIYPASCFESY